MYGRYANLSRSLHALIMSMNAPSKEILQKDVAIIGGGPCGLFTVFACGMMRLSCCVIDALERPGGQCEELYPEKPIYDIPGFPSVSARDLVTHLMNQIKPFTPSFHLGQMVNNIERLDEQWVVRTTQQDIYCKAVVIAAGAGAFTPHKPPLENLEDFEQKSVFYSVPQKNKFKNKDIVVAGGGDSAVDWALALLEVAKSVTLVHRRDVLRAAPESIEKFNNTLACGRLSKVTPFQLKALEGNNKTGELTSVIVSSLKGEVKKLKADVLLPFFGLKSTLGPILSWGLDIEKNRICIDPTTAATNKKGIYAVGDVASYPFKRKLILTGFAEAAQAAAAIHRQLFPNELASFGHSTSSGLPSLRECSAKR